MTLGRSYEEIMSRIQVTDAMRSRMLKQLAQTPSASARRPTPILRRALATAACLVLVLAGLSALPHVVSPQPLETPTGSLTAVPTLQDASSAEALSALVGFPVSEPEGLPFLVETSTYTAYGKELAQIRCEGEGQWALFRKSIGTSDNSGDYTAYAVQYTYHLDRYTVTLKGDAEDSFVLALWTDGNESYSLRLSSGLGQTAWDHLISLNS